LAEPVSEQTFGNHLQFGETHIEVKIMFSIGSNKFLILGREGDNIRVYCTLLAYFLARRGKKEYSLLHVPLVNI